MSHLDPEQLALIALGESVATAADGRHLAECGACAAEVAELRHAAVVARTTMDEATLDAPPARVWDRIHQELGLGADVAVDPTTLPTPASPVAASSDAPETSSPALTDSPPAASHAAPRRSWTKALWTLAASLVVVTVIGGGVWWGVVNATPVSIATASLDAFPDHPEAVGSAEVDESRDGARTLTVTLEGDADSDEYREVWLIRNDGGALISLGVLEGETGSFPIPAGVDLSEYDLVDISFEPVDGDPAHSGNSIVRGQLTAA